MNNQTKYCKNCGEPNLANAAFCSKCGTGFGTTSITGVSPAASPSPYYEPISSPPPRRFKKRYVLYGVVGLFALFIVAAAVIPSPSVKTASPTAIASTQTKATYIPTATYTPKIDVAAYLADYWEGGNTILVRPFTQSENARGNEVWKGVVRQTSSSYESTVVTELVDSKTEAKQVFDTSVADFTKQGYTYRSDLAATYKSNQPWLTEAWVGQSSGGYYQAIIFYYDDTNVNSWLVTTSVK